jgi:hypothetical protein
MKKPNSPTKLQLLNTLRTHWDFILYLVGAVFLRVWNLQNSLYFIYDQGRDAFVFEKLAQGKFVLVGPTSGLAGFFLGPLWYYIGFPGYLLSRGNPYGICLWYIFISCLALPLLWYFAHKLFPKQKGFAVLTAVLLAIIPGSIRASLMIWNPLLSVPLMTAALLALWKARSSRLWLAISFFCLALTLQSEFAYAVFFLIPLFVLIPWVRKKFDLRDFIVAAAAVGITFPPQLFFELRHHFLMTTSLIHSLGDKTTSLPWSDLFSRRPGQLQSVTQEILYGMSNRAEYLFPISILLMVLGAAVIIKNWRKKQNDQAAFLWQLTTLFAIIPYPFYLIWRGNFGNFFWYYLTCHFIFLIPLLVRGLVAIVEIPEFSGLKEKWTQPLKLATWSFVVFMIMSITAISADYWYAIIFKAAETNNAGLGKIVSASEKIYQWAEQDNQPGPTVRVYTSNILTEQYDYVLNWYARSHYFQLPNTVRSGNEKRWYIMVESKAAAAPIFFQPWYYEATKGGHQVREEQVGVMTLETWEK